MIRKAKPPVAPRHHFPEREASPIPYIPVEQSESSAVLQPQPEGPIAGPSRSILSDEPEQDEITRIRGLLRPPPIKGLTDWGIPPETSEACDPTLTAKFEQFRTMKTQKNMHFNDSLMSNRSFRNPHLYAKLVEFVDVSETTTNFPKAVWDPFDMKEEWYADHIAAVQKAEYERQSAAEANTTTGQRNINFTSSETKNIKRPKSTSNIGYGGIGGGGGFAGPRKRIDIGRGRER